MTAPYMPLPMWCSIGMVEQWYTQMPGFLRGEPVGEALAGIDRAHRCPGRAPGVEVDAVAHRAVVDEVISNTSPTLPRSTGPGTLPPNVHTLCLTPGATSSSVFGDPDLSTSCSVRSGAGGRTAILGGAASRRSSPADRGSGRGRTAVRTSGRVGCPSAVAVSVCRSASHARGAVPEHSAPGVDGLGHVPTCRVALSPGESRGGGPGSTTSRGLSVLVATPEDEGVCRARR